MKGLPLAPTLSYTSPRLCCRWAWRHGDSVTEKSSLLQCQWWEWAVSAPVFSPGSSRIGDKLTSGISCVTEQEERESRAQECLSLFRRSNQRMKGRKERRLKGERNGGIERGKERKSPWFSKIYLHLQRSMVGNGVSKLYWKDDLNILTLHSNTCSGSHPNPYCRSISTRIFQK